MKRLLSRRVTASIGGNRLSGWTRSCCSNSTARSRKKTKKENGSEGQRILMIVRLDFSDHEKLSQQRWLERIPSEAPFKEAHPKLIRHSDDEFAPTTKRFDDLE